MRLLFAFFCLILTFHFSTAQSALSKANTQFEMDAYQDALKSYLVNYAEHPDAPDVAVRIAECYYRMNDMMNAAKWYEKVVDQDNVSPDELLRYSGILKSLKVYGKAKYYYEKYALVHKEEGQHFASTCDFAMNAIKADPPYKISNAYFNTSSADYGPAIWDGKLVFTSFRKDIPKTRRASTLNESKGGSEIFLIDPATNSKVSFLIDDIQDHSQMGPIHFSGNGKRVAITKNNFHPDYKFFLAEDLTLSIYLANVESQGKWADLVPFPFNDNSYSIGFPWLSDDGSILFFASNMPGGYGGYDLYVSYLDKGKWSAPENLGSEINTPGNEISPYKSQSHLYFSSDYHPGIGGLDVFKTKFEKGNWSSIAHLGNGVNSPKDDFGFVYDEKTEIGYFNSDRLAGRGKMDIYKAQAQMREVVIVVRNREDKSPVHEATIQFEATGLKLVTDENGKSAIQLSKNTKDEIEILAEGYHPLTMRLANLSQSGKTMKYDVLIDKMNASESVPSPIVEKPELIVEVPALIAKTEKVVETAPVIAKEEVPVTANATPMKKVYVKQTPELKFAIQVSAFSKGNFDPEKYQTLEGIGNVYDHVENNMTKVRVGYFSTKEEAKSSLSSVRAAGYKDAFVVEQMINPGANSVVGNEATIDYSEFKIRLATYSKPGSFRAGGVEHIGKLESYRKNEMTIMLLAGFRTLVEAKKALTKAHSAGFADAYVVQDLGGVLRKVQD
jgi:tetratricopeptide (TPR) repeat protein/cell division septation protein DedD